MDNLTHTLLGLALAESGLRRRTALGTATLAIAANLPDVDVLAIPFGHGIDGRRGITHGLPAMVVLPVLLALAMVGWDRAFRRGDGTAREPVRGGWVLVLAVVGTLTHPVLDWLNTYGMRWLMPVRGTWFYGDAVYIVDPWLLAMLLVGVIASRLRRRGDAGAARARVPARWALGVATLYVVAMIGLTGVGRWVVRRDLLGGVFGTGRARYMVGPRPITPLDRQVVLDAGDRYLLTTVRLRPGGSTIDPPRELATQLADSAARAALATPAGRRFATWARFPFAVVTRTASGTHVELDDARYSDGPTPSFARVRVQFPRLVAR